MNQAIPQRRTRTNPLAVRLMLDALMDGPHTYTELVEACGLHRTTLTRWLAAWRKPTGGNPRRVYIAYWEEDRNGRRNTPAFAWGDKADAKQTPKSNSERQKLRRQRLRGQRITHALAGGVFR